MLGGAGPVERRFLCWTNLVHASRLLLTGRENISGLLYKFKYIGQAVGIAAPYKNINHRGDIADKVTLFFSLTSVLRLGHLLHPIAPEER